MKKVCVFLADGFEEIEGLTVVDILRRAGIDTETVSVMGRKQINGSHGIIVEADKLFEEADIADADMIVLPGGMPGTLNLKAHEGLKTQILSFDSQGKYIAAICAAPTVLSELGLLKGKKHVHIRLLKTSLTAVRFSEYRLLRTEILRPAGGWELRFRLR